MHVSVSLGPMVHRVGLHCNTVVTIEAKAQRAVYASSPCDVYLPSFHIDFQPMTRMKNSVTEALARAMLGIRRMLAVWYSYFTISMMWLGGRYKTCFAELFDLGIIQLINCISEPMIDCLVD